MIIVRLIGGLGNQLFQYATARSLSIKNNDEFKLDISEYEKKDNFRKYSLGYFNIIERIASQKEISHFKKNGLIRLMEKIKPYYKKLIIKYKDYSFDNNILNLTGSHYLDGYWQNEKYFKSIESVLKAEITLKNPLKGAVGELLKDITDIDSISIHIRRGDYLTDKISKNYQLCDKDYYNRAIKLMLEKIPIAKFFIFSDDPIWVKNNLPLPSSTNIVSGNKLTEYEELMLMAACKHQIIANSSFSWWGAWLNQNPNKIIIGPKKWFKLSSDDQGIMPESWIKL